MTHIDSFVLEVSDVPAAEAFYAEVLGKPTPWGLRASEAPTSGFRGYSVSLVVAQPATASALHAAALAAGATQIKPAAKSFWGFGGVVRTPDGTILKLVSSAKKDTGPATREIDQVVVLLGVADVAVTRTFYVERGLEVARGFGRKYVEFAAGSSVTLALQSRKAVAKDAGVDAEGSGSHRLVLTGDLGAVTDPDGFRWEVAPAHVGS